MQQIGELDPNAIIWRYLTFKKVAALIELRAIWFAKLGIFQDKEEGLTPEIPRQELKRQHRDMEAWYPDEQRRSQVRRFVEDNERNGRDLIVASCWFISDHESEAMWADYANDGAGVVIKSTPGALARSLSQTLKNKWWIGRIRYGDLSTHDGMNAYEASQAHLRAFIKGTKYSRENELRVATMNFVAAGCLNPDGSPPNEKQRKGYIDASNGPGIYVRADLANLIDEVRSAPSASEDHRAAIEIMLRNAGIEVPFLRSELNPRAP